MLTVFNLGELFSKIEKVRQESEPDSSVRFSGRPVSQDMMDNFNTVCDAMDDFDCELYTIDELGLRARMVCISEDPDRRKCTALNRFKGCCRNVMVICFFANVCGRKNVPAFAIWQNV